MRDAQFNLGVMYEKGRGVPQDDAEAVKWYRLAAEQGNAYAQINLGAMYRQRPGRAAGRRGGGEVVPVGGRAGMPRRSTISAVMYDEGRGVPQDDAEAVKWYRLAAEQGNAAAQYNLGVMYDKGEGVPQDDAEAVKWYRLAAEQGAAAAQ